MDPSRLDGPGQSGPLTDTSPGSARSPGLKGHPRGSFGRRSSAHTLSSPQARIDRPVDKRRASHPLPQAAFKLASFLRHSCLAQALKNALILGQIRWVVAPCRRGGAGAGDAVGWVDRKAGRDRGTRLVNSTELGESGGQPKIWSRIVSVSLDRPSTPRDRLLVTGEVGLPKARHIHPEVSQRIARTEAQGLSNLSLCFL